MFCGQCGASNGDDQRFCGKCGKPLAAPANTLTGAVTAQTLAGEQVLGGRYRLVRGLGRGGMGVVWLAHDDRLDLDVAVKVLPPELSRDERALRDLATEARLSMQLSHENIVRLHNLMDSDGLAYLVMEYVDGETLERRLLRTGKVPAQEAIRCMLQVCAGLAHAHERKVIHRDLKPSNVMICSDGTVKIADFGIARQIRDSMTRVSKRDTSGTLLYMSPEQLMGEPIAATADIYSLGCILYECISGRPPFYTGNVPTQIQFKAPATIEGVAKGMNALLEKMLAKKADERPRDAQTVSELLKPVLEEISRVTIEAEEARFREETLREALEKAARREQELREKLVGERLAAESRFREKAEQAEAALRQVDLLKMEKAESEARLAAAVHQVQALLREKEEALRSAQNEGKRREEAEQLVGESARARKEAESQMRAESLRADECLRQLEQLKKQSEARLATAVSQAHVLLKEKEVALRSAQEEGKRREEAERLVGESESARQDAERQMQAESRRADECLRQLAQLKKDNDESERLWAARLEVVGREEQDSPLSATCTVGPPRCDGGSGQPRTEGASKTEDSRNAAEASSESKSPQHPDLPHNRGDALVGKATAGHGEAQPEAAKKRSAQQYQCVEEAAVTVRKGWRQSIADLLVVKWYAGAPVIAGVLLGTALVFVRLPYRWEPLNLLTMWGLLCGLAGVACFLLLCAVSLIGAGILRSRGVPSPRASLCVRGSRLGTRMGLAATPIGVAVGLAASDVGEMPYGSVFCIALGATSVGWTVGYALGYLWEAVALRRLHRSHQ